jgi:hypothetical protein
MFILLAHNRTGTKPDGTSDYAVEARINDRTIVQLSIKGHVRDSGAANLLRLIADAWDKQTGRDVSPWPATLGR